MQTRSQPLDFIESMIVLFAFIGFTYTLYSFIAFSWDRLTSTQIIIAVFGWIAFWQLLGFVFILLYRFCTGQLVLFQKIGDLLSRQTK